MTLFADFNPNVSVPFSRVRQLFEDSALQAGVVGASDFKVAQRGAGANQSVDVPAGQAWVEVTTGTRNGIAHIVNDATANVAVTASHATLPRIDQLVLQYNDSSIPTGSGDVPTLAVLSGTATSGATLDNRTGAAALGNDRVRLADILVPAASTSVTTANIRDRRPWARGAFVRLRGSASGTSYTNATNTLAAVDAANLQARVECSGTPLRFNLSATWSNSAGTAILEVTEDGAAIPALEQENSNAGVSGLIVAAPYVPTAGSHVFGISIRSTTGTVTILNNTDVAGSARPVFTIEEIIRQNASNT